MWADVGPWLAQGGVTAAVLWGAVTLVRIAVSAERRRADDQRERGDDWRDAARTTAEANQLMNANVQKLVQSVEQLAASQRETTHALHTLSQARLDGTHAPPSGSAI